MAELTSEKAPEMLLEATQTISAREALSVIRVEIEEPTPAIVSRSGVLAIVVMASLREALASFNDGGRQSILGYGGGMLMFVGGDLGGELRRWWRAV
jgi:hypothetical protein